MRVLVVNAGSSSLKVSLVDDGATAATYDGLPDRLPAVDAVGHRIVHGGTEFVAPVVVDAAVEDRLRALGDLAPLHQDRSLRALDEARTRLPEVPHVACFDTAFHATLPEAAATYPVPEEWRSRHGVRRYGFHGLAHAWASRRARELVPGARRVVTCHLGAGASLAAVLDGRSVDTTMGFTPLDGLVMATRSGSLDPGLVLWMQQHVGLTAAEVADALEHRSGLRALAATADMREILGRDDPAATLAIAVYVHRLRGMVAAMAAATGGLDVLVFTGGVGEHAPGVRAATAAGLSFLGVSVDPTRNEAARPDADITADGSRARCLVLAAREDLEIAAGVTATLS